MHRLAIAVAALVFFLNPGFGCSSGQEDNYQYGEAEMKTAVEGTWVLTLGASAGSPNEVITVRVAESSKAHADNTRTVNHRRGMIRAAAACGTRTLVASAHACIDSSEMPLDVTLVSGPDSYKAVPLSGNLAVHSLIFSQGSFGLSFGTLYVSADITPDGSVQSLYGGHSDGSVIPVLSLVRTAK